MVRTHIQLTDEQSRRLKAQAATQRVSVAELLRRLVDRSLPEQPTPNPTELRKRALAASGCGHSGLRDISERHDDYLAEIYAE
jgi:hypothetical protein